MKTGKFIKKPDPIEAVLLTEENFTEVYEWIEKEGKDKGIEPFLTGETELGEGIIISTLEGDMTAYPNLHYIVKGLEGEFYPVKKEIFEKTYVGVPLIIDDEIANAIFEEEEEDKVDIAVCDICRERMEELIFKNEVIMCPDCLKKDEWEIIKELIRNIKSLENRRS